MKRLMYLFVGLIFSLLISSCGVEEIDACVGAASDPLTYDIDCDDCCKANGYKRGLTSSSSSGSNTSRECKCSGDPD